MKPRSPHQALAPRSRVSRDLTAQATVPDDTKDTAQVHAAGKISLAGFTYSVGAAYAGEPVEVVVAGGLVNILHAGVVVATHAQRLREDQEDRKPRARVSRRARDATAGLTVTRLADGAGVVSFAGTPYACGRRWARTAIDVTVVAGSVQLSRDGKVIRVHPIRHDHSRELGAFANPKGQPRRKNTAAACTSCKRACTHRETGLRPDGDVRAEQR